MGKQTVRAKDVLRDLKAGVTDAELMNKYRLSEKGLQSLFRKLKEGGFVSDADLGARPGPTESAPVSPEDELQPPEGRPAPAPAGLGPDVERAHSIAADMKAGKHPNEIMQRYELSPKQLERIVEQLQERGLIDRDDVAGGKPKPPALCPQCGAEVPEGAARCGHCGEMVGDHPGAALAGTPLPGSPPRPEPIAAYEEIKECPWEEAANYGLWRAYFLTAKRILLTPSNFFSDLPLEGGFLNPILFGIASTVLSVTIGMLGVTLLRSHSGFGLFGILIGVVCTLFGAAIIVPIVLMIWSLMIHAALTILQGAARGFEATFRVVAYSSVTQLFNAIPFVGTIASLYGLVLTVIGLKETHDTSTGLAVGAVLLPLAVVVIVVGVFAAATLSQILGSMPR
jgi:Mor family transcriptional regulator